MATKSQTVTDEALQKTPDKVHLAVNHEKLNDAKTVDRWKSYWKGFLQKLLKQFEA